MVSEGLAGSPISVQSLRRLAGSWTAALRLPHWVKNTLVFVAPVLGVHALTRVVAEQAALLFVLMGVLASGSYLVNDLVDLEADRRHPVKCFRPLAAGAISQRTGKILAAVLIFVAVLMGIQSLPRTAAGMLLGYLALTLAYSFWLKRAAMVDVLTLAGLFTIRIAAGGALAVTPQSPWLLTFSMLFFLSLAMAKRYAELERVCREDGVGGTGARGYTVRDLPMMLSGGMATGISAVVIFTVYLINEQYPRSLYENPSVLWAIMPILLAWMLRIWHLAANGRLNEDPVMYAIRDRTSLALGALVLVALLVAWV